MEKNKKEVGAFLNQLERQGQKAVRKSRPGSNIELVDQILPSVMNGLGLEKRLREHTLLQLWPSFLSANLAQRSRGLFIDHQHNLVVAVSDAAVAQELSLMKSRLLLSLRSAAQSLGLEIAGLRIDMKNFHRPPELPPEAEQRQRLPQISEDELAKVELNEHDKQLIVDLSKKLADGSDFERNLKSKALHAYEGQLRLAHWRRQMGFPLCGRCASPVSKLYELDMHKVCFNCWAASKI